MYLATTEIMQKLDHETITGCGIPGMVLMENAGRGVFRFLISQFTDLEDRRVAIIAGRGNNGGDGFVVSRYLSNAGIENKVFLLTSKDKVQGDALMNLDIIIKMGVPLEEITSSSQWENVFEEIKSYHLVIDAIFGTGINTEIQGFFRDVIEDVNTLSFPKVSIDIPSGLNASTGRIMGITVRADYTVTLGLPKVGLVVFPGADYAGRVRIADISIPSSLIEEKKIPYHLLLVDDIAKLISRREADTHKGDFGHLLVLAGSPGKTGAAALTCDAALRIGTGLVTLGIARSLNPVMESKLTEVMTEPLPEEEPGFMGMKALETIQHLMTGKTVLAIGPGISIQKNIPDLIRKILEDTTIPAVIDADGINCLSRDPSVLKKVNAPIVLTPHPGEMARLLRCSSQEVQEDRIGVSRHFSQEYGVYVVLKGARTIIAEPNGTVRINPTGNPGMASGGVGDTLTGMIAGLIAQGYPIDRALSIAVFLHGLIGDMLASMRGGVGITAGDIIRGIPEAIKILEKKDISQSLTYWSAKNLFVC